MRREHRSRLGDEIGDSTDTFHSSRDSAISTQVDRNEQPSARQFRRGHRVLARDTNQWGVVVGHLDDLVSVDLQGGDRQIFSSNQIEHLD